MTDQTGGALAPYEESLPAALPDLSASALALDERAFGRVMALAEVMASSKVSVPQHLRGQKGDCAAVVMQAFRWRMDPFAVAMKTHVVQGTLGYEAQLVNAAINTMAPTKDRLHFEWFGAWEKIVGKFKAVQSNKTNDDGSKKEYRVPAWNEKDEEGLGVRCWATLKGENEPRVLELLMAQARTRNSTLWADDPKQQIAYLATKRWSRLYCPDVILGVYTPDELDERPAKSMGNVEVVGAATVAELSDQEMAPWIAAAKKGKDAARAFWQSSEPAYRKRASEATRARIWEMAVKADEARTHDTGTPPATPAATSTDAPDPAASPASTASTASTVSADNADFVADMDAVDKAAGAGS